MTDFFLAKMRNGGLNMVITEELIGGRYRMLRRLGGGRFGDVYLAKEVLGGKEVRTVAVKVYKNDSSGKGMLSEYTAMVRAVSICGAEIRHFFQEVYSSGIWDSEAGPKSYFAMEFMEAGTLEDAMEGDVLTDGFSAEQAESIALQLFRALSALHNAGLVHRDITPGNLYLQKGKVRIGDFGISLENGDGLQQISGTAGKYIYMAPEAYGNLYCAASDVYSAGLTIYKLCTGFQPFEQTAAGSAGTDEMAFVQTRMRQEWVYQSIHDFGRMRGTSPKLDRVLKKCLAYLVHERYSSAAEVAHDLEADTEEIPAEKDKREVYMAKQCLAENPLGALAHLESAERFFAGSPREKLEILLLKGQAYKAAGMMEEYHNYLMKAFSFDEKNNVLYKERTLRKQLIKEICGSFKSMGQMVYAAIYEKKLENV